MPRYKNGLQAAIGDIVRGTGVHAKNADGSPKEIIGAVIGITKDWISMNNDSMDIVCSITSPREGVPHLEVAYIEVIPVGDLDPGGDDKYRYVARGPIGCGPDGGDKDVPYVMGAAKLEYGPCDQFEKIA